MHLLRFGRHPEFARGVSEEFIEIEGKTLEVSKGPGRSRKYRNCRKNTKISGRFNTATPVLGGSYVSPKKLEKQKRKKFYLDGQ